MCILCIAYQHANHGNFRGVWGIPKLVALRLNLKAFQGNSHAILHGSLNAASLSGPHTGQ